MAGRELGIDRIELRRRNVIRREMLPYLTPTGLTYECGDFAGNMERVLTMADWQGFSARRGASGAVVGVGLTGWGERATCRFRDSHVAVIGSAVWLGVGNAIRHGQRVSTTHDHVP